MTRVNLVGATLVLLGLWSCSSGGETTVIRSNPHDPTAGAHDATAGTGEPDASGGSNEDGAEGDDAATPDVSVGQEAEDGSDAPEPMFTVDAGSDGAVMMSASCPGWTLSGATNCSSNDNNGSCSATCFALDGIWQADCQNGMCACERLGQTLCMCSMPAGPCKPCCPGMTGTLPEAGF